MANELTLGQLLSAGAQGTQSGRAAQPIQPTESVKGMVDIVNMFQQTQPNYVPGQRQSTNVVDQRNAPPDAQLQALVELILGRAK